MKIGRVASAVLVSIAMTGLASAQAAGQMQKPQPLRNQDPSIPKHGPRQDSPEWGGPRTQYSRVSATQFVSDVASDDLTSSWNPGFAGYDYQRFFFSSGFNHLVSSPTLPGGARVTYIEFDACDNNAMDQHARLDVYGCDYHGACDGTPIATITSVSDVQNPCGFWTAGADYRVLNLYNQVLLDVTFGATDGSNTFAGVILGYVLDVAPAPPAATFGDVPTDHPFFQFIEALAASQVTGGCQAAPPLYCPNNPVTRGQMAVFLSKLTGLGAWE
jgi:hypothetical protein